MLVEVLECGEPALTVVNHIRFSPRHFEKSFHILYVIREQERLLDF